jgi:hypothetical protein
MQFAREFFRTYSQPTEQFTFTTKGEGILPRPWLGQIRLKDINGSVLTVRHFDSIKVEFDHNPKFTVTLGPQTPTYPDGPDQPDRRYEVQPVLNLGDGENRPNISITSLGSFSGVSGAPS